MRKVLSAARAVVALCSAESGKARPPTPQELAQFDATDKISHCIDDKYKHHHVECGRRVMAQTPPENRNETFMKYFNEILPLSDETDQRIDVTFARLDRQIWWEKFTKDIKAAPVSDKAGVIRQYCTGRGNPRIGMDWLEVRHGTSWCIPFAVNRTTTAAGSRHQDVYQGNDLGSGGNTGYLYYDDKDRLVMIQSRH